MCWMLYSICLGFKKADAKISWQSVSELIWLCPSWGEPGTRKCLAEHRDLISLSVKHGQQGTDWGISKPCEKCHWSSCSSIFFSPSVMAVAGEQSRAQKSPSSASDPGDRRNHIISAVTQSHCQGVVEGARGSSGVMLETQKYLRRLISARG